MTEYTMLPEKDNFKRLVDCDFNTITEYETDSKKTLKKSLLPCTLKHISNPILILFYYEDTERKILTQFFESSYGKNLEEGNQDDLIYEKTDDQAFTFGFVNLDSEQNILKTFRNLNGLNPFSWAKIENTQGTFEKYPFILFYYNTLPQFMYEGFVDSETIKSEFSNWRKELLEIENKEILNNQQNRMNKEGYFKALENDKPIKGIVKGQKYFLSITENSAGMLDYVIKLV